MNTIGSRASNHLHDANVLIESVKIRDDKDKFAAALVHIKEFAAAYGNEELMEIAKDLERDFDMRHQPEVEDDS
jgi:hypothetical protein